MLTLTNPYFYIPKKDCTFTVAKNNRRNSINSFFNDKELPAKGNVSERSIDQSLIVFCSPKVGDSAYDLTCAMKKRQKIVGQMVAPAKQPLPAQKILQTLLDSEDPKIMREHLRTLWDDFILNNDYLEPKFKKAVYATYSDLSNLLLELVRYEESIKHQEIINLNKKQGDGKR